MFKLKTFFRTFVKSFQPNYYKDILKAKFSFSFKYLVFLVFLVSTASTIMLAVSLLPLRSKIPGFVENAKKVVTEIYPEKLVVSVKDGKISTNVREPYFIDMPKSVDWKMGEGHLIAIDTKGGVEDYAKYNSAILFTDSYVVVPQDSDSYESYRVYPLDDALKDSPNGVVLNKEIYQSLSSQVIPYIDNLPQYLTALFLVVVVVGPVLATLVSLAWYMAGLLFLSVVFLITAKLMKKDLSYSEIYRLSMHGITLPILIGIFVHVPFVFSIIFLIFMIIVFSKFNK